MEIRYHIRRGNDLSHLSEAGDPSKELVADCDVGADHKMPVPIGAIEYICTCAEAIHNCIQEVDGKTQAHTLLLTTEHSKVLLGVGSSRKGGLSVLKKSITLHVIAYQPAGWYAIP